ncbi:MAG: DNA topoisomerase VI subunit B [Candidatus Micrarchaeia archaeon]
MTDETLAADGRIPADSRSADNLPDKIANDGGKQGSQIRESSVTKVARPQEQASITSVRKSEDIFEEFREHSVAEFFKKNRQMLGFAGKVKSLTTVVHEAVTNSLDACEEAKILPNIYVKIENVNNHLKVYVEDNGPGIPKDYIGKALGQMLAGTKFHRYVQQRGQQGIGISGCIMFSQITTGKQTHVRSGTGNGRIYECDVSIDLKTNKPHVANMIELPGNYRGLTIVGEYSEVKNDMSEYSPYEYLKATAMANPHAQITFVGPDGARTVFARASDVIPKRPVPAQPHPLGVTTNDLIEQAHHSKERKLSSFLIQNFARVSDAKVDELKAMCPGINFDKMPRELRWDEAEMLVSCFKKIKWIAPSAEPLRPIGKQQIEKAMKAVLNPEFMSVTERAPKVYRGGVPFMVESAICYGGKSGRQTKDGTVGLDVKRFANRAPLLFDAGGCAITEAVKTIDWGRYGLKNIDQMPVTLFINLVSVFIPYTGAGKQAIASEEEILEELRFAIMEVARDLDRYLSGKIRDEQREMKRKAIMRYVKQIASDLPYLSSTDLKSEELEKKLIYLIENKYTKIFEHGRGGGVAAAEAEAEEIARKAAKHLKKAKKERTAVEKQKTERQSRDREEETEE